MPSLRSLQTIHVRDNDEDEEELEATPSPTRAPIAAIPRPTRIRLCTDVDRTGQSFTTEIRYLYELSVSKGNVEPSEYAWKYDLPERIDGATVDLLSDLLCSGSDEVVDGDSLDAVIGDSESESGGGTGADATETNGQNGVTGASGTGTSNQGDGSVPNGENGGAEASGTGDGNQAGIGSASNAAANDAGDAESAGNVGEGVSTNGGDNMSNSGGSLGTANSEDDIVGLNSHNVSLSNTTLSLDDIPPCVLSVSTGARDTFENNDCSSPDDLCAKYRGTVRVTYTELCNEEQILSGTLGFLTGGDGESDILMIANDGPSENGTEMTSLVFQEYPARKREPLITSFIQDDSPLRNEEGGLTAGGKTLMCFLALLLLLLLLVCCFWRRKERKRLQKLADDTRSLKTEWSLPTADGSYMRPDFHDLGLAHSKLDVHKCTSATCNICRPNLGQVNMVDVERRGPKAITALDRIICKEIVRDEGKRAIRPVENVAPSYSDSVLPDAETLPAQNGHHDSMILHHNPTSSTHKSTKKVVEPGGFLGICCTPDTDNEPAELCVAVGEELVEPVQPPAMPNGMCYGLEDDMGATEPVFVVHKRAPQSFDTSGGVSSVTGMSGFASDQALQDMRDVGIGREPYNSQGDYEDDHPADHVVNNVSFVRRESPETMHTQSTARSRKYRKDTVGKSVVL